MTFSFISNIQVQVYGRACTDVVCLFVTKMTDAELAAATEILPVSDLSNASF
jgi:hypothetical protein